MTSGYSSDAFVRKYLSEHPEAHHLREMWTSHLGAGLRLVERGRLREALIEFAKEHSRPIKTDIDAEIVQMSYVHVGRTYRELGELEKAIPAFQKARELYRELHAGWPPNLYLVDIYIEQGRLDEAKALFQEELESIPAEDLNMRRMLTGTYESLAERGRGSPR